MNWRDDAGFMGILTMERGRAGARSAVDWHWRLGPRRRARIAGYSTVTDLAKFRG